MRRRLNAAAIRSERAARLLTIPFAVLLGSIAFSSCGPTAPQNRYPIELSLTLETEHFSLRYSEQGQGVIADYATALEANYDRIVNDFLMTGIPRVTARFYHDQQTFTAATGYANLGRTFSSGVFALVAQPINLDGAVHELTHCATLVFCPTAYFVEKWGWARLRELILSHANVPGVLGVSWGDFQSGWEAFVLDRYL